MIILGLGSNLGDREAHLRAALAELLPLLKDMKCSRVLESRALLPKDAPQGWDLPFLNMAVSGRAELPPQALFAQVKNIEKRLGRKAQGTWSPREIDIDILAMESVALDTPQLHIPHRALLDRDFALLPLIDLSPAWRYPLPGPYHQWTATHIAADKGYALGKHLHDTGLDLHE